MRIFHSRIRTLTSVDIHGWALMVRKMGAELTWWLFAVGGQHLLANCAKGRWENSSGFSHKEEVKLRVLRRVDRRRSRHV